MKTLQEKVMARKGEIEKTADLLDRVLDNLRRVRTSIDRASSELEMHEPIGTDIAAIKRQQEELKLFQTSVLEPLQKREEDVMRDAQQLVQSAAPGVDTGGLESDVEILHDKWSELNEKVCKILLKCSIWGIFFSL